MALFYFSLPYWDLTEPPGPPDTDEEKDELVAYGSCLAKRVAEGFDVKTTDGTLEENKAGVFDASWEFYWGVGHGDEDVYAVKYLKIFLRTPDIGVRIMGGRVVHLLSCLTGAKLGPDLVVKFGAKAYVGYEKDFVIGSAVESLPAPGTEPSSEQDLYTAPDCDLEIQRQLLGGASLENAVKASQARFEREVGRYETGDRKDWYIAGVMARDLFHDMGAQVMYESKAGVPPSKWEKYGPGLKAALAMGSLGLGAVMLGKPALEERGLI